MSWQQKSYITCLAASLVILFGIAWRVNARTAKPQEIQDWWLTRIPDTLPQLENIWNCKCPRIYIPVCGSNNQSYNNVCRMNCINVKLKRTKKNLITVASMGVCTSFFEPYAY